VLRNILLQLTPWLWKQHFAENPLRSDLYDVSDRRNQTAGCPVTLIWLTQYSGDQKPLKRNDAPLSPEA